MVTTEQVRDIVGSTAVDINGSKIGKVGNVYFDDETGQPAWATVNTGLFGTSESFVPLDRATVEGDSLTVPYDKDKIKDAPRVGDDGHIDRDEEDRLYEYYGLGGRTEAGTRSGTTTGRSDARSTDTYEGVRTDDEDASGTAPAGRTGDRRGGEASGIVGHDTSGPTTDDAMTRSEERLHVGTESREAGRARLRKYVVTEEENVTVPVTREEVRLEREPITEGNAPAAHDGPSISEEEHEVVLHEERPVVSKETAPVERVRLGKEQVSDDARVSEEVRKEQIEADGVDTERR